MKDEDKSKEQIIKELKELRCHIPTDGSAGNSLILDKDICREIIDLAPDVIVVVNKLGIIEFCNVAAERIAGYSKNELIGKHFVKLGVLHLKDIPKYLKVFARIVRGKVIQPIEVDIVGKDGTRSIVEVRVSLLEDGRVLSIATDITERKNAENKLRESQGLLQKAEQIARIGSWELDLSTNKIIWSKEMYKIFGIKPEEFNGAVETGINRIHPDDRMRAITVSQAAIREKRPYHVEYRLVYPDGAELHVLARCDIICNNKGEVIKVIGTLQDITESKKAGEALKLSEERYRRFIATSIDAIMIFDADTKEFIDVNPSCEKLYGYSREEFLTLKQFDITAEPGKTSKSIEKALRRELTRIPLRYHKKKDGTIFPVEISASFFSSDNRRLVCGITRDITERKKAEEEKERLHQQIMQSEKMAAIGEIGAGIAHELNTPLNVILGYQELMKKKIAKCPEFKEYLDISIEEVEQCRQLIGDFLLYARPSADSGMLKKHSVDITAVIKSIIKLSSIHKEKNIKIKLDIEDNFPLITGDQKQITQVFMNVLNNAIQAMPGGGDVTISARHIKNGGIAKNGGIIEFRITDTGEGIPKENITKVFDPFFTSKRPGKGTGLGLAVCHRIMENHKGTIRIESESGRGTTIIGTLPV